MQLTDRDRKIIQAVSRHRFLRSDHILALIGGSSQQLLRRLKLLYHHGYLERPRAQIDYYRHGGSRAMVYGLGRKSGDLVNQEPGLPFRELNWSEKNGAIGRLFLDHALLISDVMVALEVGCRSLTGVRLLTGGNLPLPGQLRHSKDAFRWSVKTDGNLKLGVAPDQVFAIETPDKPAGTNRILFFLEADRATMPVMRQNLHQTSFYRKLLAYAATWKRGIHRSRFGVHRFRVLTVTSSRERVETLLTACKNLDGGHGLFLFAERGALSDGKLLTDAWRSPRDVKSVRLLD